MGGEAFKRRLVCSDVVAIVQLCTTVKSFITNVLNCKVGIQQYGSTPYCVLLCYILSYCNI